MARVVERSRAPSRRGFVKGLGAAGVVLPALATLPRRSFAEDAAANYADAKDTCSRQSAYHRSVGGDHIPGLELSDCQSLEVRLLPRGREGRMARRCRPHRDPEEQQAATRRHTQARGSVRHHPHSNQGRLRAWPDGKRLSEASECEADLSRQICGAIPMAEGRVVTVLRPAKELEVEGDDEPRPV